MKDYLLEQWFWVKTHRVKFFLVSFLPIFLVGLWIIVTIPEDPRYLNIYPIIAFFVVFSTSIMVADLDIRKMRRSDSKMRRSTGIRGVLIAGLILYGSPAQSRLIGDNTFQIYLESEPLFEPTLTESEIQQILHPEVGQAIAACIIAGVVIGFVGCEVVPFCEKHFGKPSSTNSEPDELWATGDSGGDSYAAMSCAHNKDCGGGDDLNIVTTDDDKPILVHVKGKLVEYGGYPTIENFRIVKRPTTDIVGPEEWRAGLRTLGLGEGYGSGSTFGKNGVPVEENEVPIRIYGNGSIGILSNYQTYQVSIERSFDMVSWQRLVSIQCAAGYSLSIGDMSGEGRHAFYRMRVFTP